MRFSHFFIDRPIFASVLSILLLLLGSIAYLNLPIAQYPEIAPPTIVVRATYPGANAETVAATVSTPLEQEINGVEDMLYMSSYSTGDGAMSLTVTFALGTDLDAAQVLVQNRVSIAEPRLPEEVRRLGVTTRKSSPDLMMVVHMLSPDETYDQLYISGYARSRVRDVLLRLGGVGDITIFGERQYSLRVWLDPEKIAALGMTAGDVIAAIREQNVQVTGGTLGQQPAPTDNAFQFVVTTQGRFEDPRQFRQVIVRSTPDGRLVRVQDVARVEFGAQDYATNSYLDGKAAVGMGIFQRPGHQCARRRRAGDPVHGGPEAGVPPGARLPHRLQPDGVHPGVGERGLQDLHRGGHPGRDRGDRVPAVLAHGDHPDRRDPRVADRHLRGDVRARVLAQQPDALRPDPRHRHRGGRRHRGGGERRARDRQRRAAGRGRAQDHGRGRRGADRHRAGARRRVHPDRLHPGITGQFYRSSRSPSRSRR
jgi:hypothetical protein